MSEYGMRLKYEMIAKFLNDHGAYISEDGDALFIKGDTSYLWIEESYRINDDNTSTTVWKVKPE